MSINLIVSWFSSFGLFNTNKLNIIVKSSNTRIVKNSQNINNEITETLTLNEDLSKVDDDGKARNDKLEAMAP